DATQALPSMSGARLGSAPTTPLPRATGTRPPVDGAVAAPLLGERPRRSVLSGLLLWLVIVGAVFGGGGFYAYKQGLIFAKPTARKRKETRVTRRLRSHRRRRLRARRVAWSCRTCRKVRASPSTASRSGEIRSTCHPASGT